MRMAACRLHPTLPWGERGLDKVTVRVMAGVCSRCRVIDECNNLAVGLEARGVEISGVWAGQRR